MPAKFNTCVRTFRLIIFSLLLSASFMPLSVLAQDTTADAVVTDFLNVYQSTSDKAVQLAGAIPSETYDWRPAEGVRSVREAILHLTSGNYFFGSMMGMTTPENVDPRSLEQSGMNKDEAINALKESVAYIKSGIQNISAGDFDTKIDFFGNEITKRQAMFILGDHTAEHLGQLIAYARSNGIAPPWSR